MAFLIFGGNGKTSSRLAQLLKADNRNFVLTSRKPPSSNQTEFPYVRFDWQDRSTYELPFKHSFPAGQKIEAVYLMNPHLDDPATPMNAFIDYAHKEHGVKRFVLVAGTTAQPGSKGIGQIWQHFIDVGVEYAVLRPSWFMENLAEEGVASLVRKFSTIWSCAGDGEIPWISADDISAVAFQVLTTPEPPNRDFRVLGSELLTFDDVAKTLSKVLGRDVKHVKLTPDEREKQLKDAGLGDFLSAFLRDLEVKTSENFEKAQNTVVKDLTGKPPKTLEQFVTENKDTWKAE